MTTYHPFATAIDKDGNEQKLLTYDGFSSMEECLKQFDLWQEEYGYKIKTACMQIIKDGGTVENRYYENKWVEAESIRAWHDCFRPCADDRDGMDKKGRAQMIEWINVNDRLPKSKPEDLEYPMVIIALSDGTVELGCYYESTHEWGAGENFDRPRSPIAWMPLPEPPAT